MLGHGFARWKAARCVGSRLTASAGHEEIQRIAARIAGSFRRCALGGLRLSAPAESRDVRRGLTQ